MEIQAIYCKGHNHHPEIIIVQQTDLKNLLISGLNHTSNLKYALASILITRLYPSYSEILHHLDLKIPVQEFLDMGNLFTFNFNRIIDTLINTHISVYGPFLITGLTKGESPLVSLPKYRQEFWLNRLYTNKYN